MRYSQHPDLGLDTACNKTKNKKLSCQTAEIHTCWYDVTKPVVTSPFLLQSKSTFINWQFRSTAVPPSAIWRLKHHVKQHLHQPKFLPLADAVCFFTRLYHTCDSTTIRLRHDYDEKLTCSFFARVESRRMEAGAHDTS